MEAYPLYWEATAGGSVLQNHCNVGNGQLTIDVICDWIVQTDRTEYQQLNTAFFEKEKNLSNMK